MSYIDPLDSLKSVNENVYFRKANADAIEALRLRRRARELGEATGVTDEDLTRHLAELGIDSETVRVLHLVPLIQVAWADGHVDPEERALIEIAAHERGIGDKPKAKALLEAMLDGRPTAEVCRAALDFCRLVISADTKEGEEVSSLEEMALRVAEAHGGFFGIGTVTERERRTLNKIAEHLKGAALS